MQAASFAERLAQKAIDHYHTVLPAKKGKPTSTEWTVYAAIIASVAVENNNARSPRSDEQSWVVCCATGTKCTSVQQWEVPTKGNDDGDDDDEDVKNSNQDLPSLVTPSTILLHDCHAEVLCRRALVRVLWEEVAAQKGRQRQQDSNQQHDDDFPSLTEKQTRTAVGDCGRELLEEDDHVGDGSGSELPKFRLKRNIKLHLYVSDSPCGDASIYPIKDIADESETLSQHGAVVSGRVVQQFTGAKVVVDPQKTGVSVDSSSFTVSEQHPYENQIRGIGTEGAPRGLLIQPIDNHQQGKAPAPTSNANPDCGGAVLGREMMQDQLLGKLRSKSGRSNLHHHQRSYSMSCSDKLVRWSVLGLQGTGPLRNRIPSPIRFATILVSADPRAASTSTTTSDCGKNDNESPQQSALHRAIVQRVHDVQQDLLKSLSVNDGCGINQRELEQFASSIELPVVSIVCATFPVGKAMTESLQTSSATFERSSNINHAVAIAGKRKRMDEETSKVSPALAADEETRRPLNSQRPKRKKLSPCGFSLVWSDQAGLVAGRTSQSLPRQSDRGKLEILIGARGIRHGKKPICVKDYIDLKSQLCRCEWMKLSNSLYVDFESMTTGRAESDDHNGWKDYDSWKDQQGCQFLQALKKRIFAHGPLAGWIVGCCRRSE